MSDYKELFLLFILYMLCEPNLVNKLCNLSLGKPGDDEPLGFVIATQYSAIVTPKTYLIGSSNISIATH